MKVCYAIIKTRSIYGAETKISLVMDDTGSQYLSFARAMPGIDARRVPKRAVELLCRGRLLRRSEQRAKIPQFRVFTGRSN